MTAKLGDIEGVVVPRYQQLLRLLAGIMSAILQAAVLVVKSTYQLVRPRPPKSLQGEVVLVTGAGHGIGRQLALEFWAQGCTVICVDTNEECNRQTARDINTKQLVSSNVVAMDGSKSAYAYTCDVRDRVQVAELARCVQKEIGRIDILVNNADTMPAETFHRTRPTEVVDSVNVNLLAHFWTLLAFLPGMVERNHGHVVAVSSVAGLCGLSSKVPYTASKIAIGALMDAVSAELKLDSHNIKLTCAHPYFVHTRPDLPQSLDLRIPELSKEHAAVEIVNAVRHNLDTITVPRNLLLWINILRTLPQDAREVWRDIFQTRVTPANIVCPPPQQHQTLIKT